MQALDVIGENPEFLAVNKPQDLVCHPTKGDEWSSLISRARMHLGGPAFLVNRLDRETSGVVLVARTGEVAGELGRLFETNRVRKQYTAIVHGTVLEEKGTIAAPLGKDERSPVAIKDCVRPDGATAVTDYVVVKRFQRQGRPFTLLRVLPASGRKHQIRIHLGHIGHPIVGDKIYGNDETIYLRLVTGSLTDADRATLLLPNHALHAGVLEFAWRGQPIRFEASTPPMFDDFLNEPAA